MRLIADASQSRPVFDPRLIVVGFLVTIKSHWYKFFTTYLCFLLPVSFLKFFTFTQSSATQCCMILATDSVAK